MRKALVALSIFFISTAALADGPNYRVFPQLKGLVVNYNVSTSNVETTLYVTNHERRSVICDANMITNRQETSNGRDTVVPPGKTVLFSFRHGKSITDVRLYLMCEADKNAPPEDSATSAAETQKNTTEKTPPPAPIIPVVEEDLDRY
ncbi:MAG: hypothetical protein R3E67_01425 [Pseudomonadales bacterium]